jgi:hypothetical protein
MISLINIKQVKNIITLLFILLISYILFSKSISYNIPINFNYQDSVMENNYPNFKK